MAVYTKVSSEQLSRYLSLYGIGKLVSHTGIEHGVSNTNFFVTTDQGKYVLTLFEPHRVRPEDIPYFLSYTIHLEQNGIPCPKTIPHKDGSFLGMLNERPAAIFSVLEGEEGHVEMLNADLCEKAGTMLAKMHLAVHDFTHTSPNHFGLHCWQDWLVKIGPQINDIEEGLFKFAADECDFLASHWPKNLPSGSIHADYFPDNVFFKDRNITGVIDFHFVCTDYFIYDLAIALNAWSFDENNVFREDRFDAFLRGYESLRPLSKEEDQSLPLLLRAAALRFLLSRCEEKLKWKQGDFMKPHDPMVFERRLHHFQTQMDAAA